MNIVDAIENEISFGDLSFAQIAEKYNVTVFDVELIFEQFMNHMAEYYGEPALDDTEYESAD